MQLPMVYAAQWDRKLVTYLQTHCPRLRETQVMGVSWLTAANQTGLRSNEQQVLLVTQPLRHNER